MAISGITHSAQVMATVQMAPLPGEDPLNGPDVLLPDGLGMDEVVVAPPPTPMPRDPVGEKRAAWLAERALEESEIRALVVVMTLRGYSPAVIARGLGVSRTLVRRVQRQARIDGHLDGGLTALQTEALPLAIEGLTKKLRQGDWNAIKETLRGLGAFRTYAHTDDQSQKASQTLDVTFVMPARPQLMDAQGIIGSPRAMEVIDADPAAAPSPGAAAAPADPDDQ